MTQIMTTYPELPGESMELIIPNERNKMIQFLREMPDYEHWMKEELEELKARQFTPGDCIPDNVLLSRMERIGGSGNKGFSNPVHTAYIDSIKDARQRNEMIEKIRKTINRNLYKITYIRILINRYLSLEERTAIEVRLFRKGSYDSYERRVGGKRGSRATYYRRVYEGVDHLLMLLERYYCEEEISNV